MIRKLRKKFIIAAVVSVFLVLSVLIGSMNVLNYRNLVSEADDTLQILSENRGAFPRQMFLDKVPPDDTPIRQGGGNLYAFRRGGNGELAYQSRYYIVWFTGGEVSRINLDNLVSLTEEEAEALALEVYASGLEKGFAGDYRFRRTEGDGETMLLFLHCQRERATFFSFLYASVGISLAGVLAVFLLLALFSGRIVRPIAESYEKQKRFITDAGHELKTPITIIRADAEVLQMELDEENEWITDIRAQTDRLSELTAELIYLSKMEEENVALQMRDVALSELVDGISQSFQALALSGGRELRSSVVPDIHVSGDEKALSKLVSILLDNAMKYSPEGEAVRLSLSSSGKAATLVVKNRAASMEKGNADRLFERFTREDRSRSSESGGFGLGLAIAKAVVEAHKGKIHAQSEDGASLTVTVELPLA